MSSTEVIDDITSKIAELLKSNLDEGNKLTASDFGQRCAKIYKEYDSKTAIITTVLKEEKIKKRSASKYNLYVQKQMTLMKEEDNKKPKEERRSSQLMMKEIAKKWNEGDKDIFI